VARQVRYDALRALLGAEELLLTAHHQQDQAETLLVQMFRGAGPRGLAAMPRCSRFGPGWIARPLLEVTTSTLEAYASAARLDWVEDPSNRETRYERNFVRHAVLPNLRERWPNITKTLTRVAAHQAQASALADVVAATDLASIRGVDAKALCCSALTSLSRARQYNALRAWLREQRLSVPAQAHLTQIVTTVIAAGSDRTPVVKWPGSQVRRYRGSLYCMPDAGCAEQPPQGRRWHLPEPLTFPHGRLEASAAQGFGLRRSLMESVEVAFRRGGERCRPVGRQHSQSLKKLFQERGVPPWERNRIPLVYVDGQLAAVAGLWLCHPFAAQAGDPGWVLQWTAMPLGAQTVSPSVSS
jgi:tRNA(Ile)-lysidine synthase